MGQTSADPGVHDGAARGATVFALLFALAAAVPGGGAAVSDRVIRLEGEVARPGWYEAPSLGGAALAAGGEAPALLSREVPDGATVRIVGDWATVPTAPDLPVLVPVAARGGVVHLNTASLAELESLPRVGPTLAARIVAGRPYRSLADVDRVKGIGPATLAALRGKAAP